MEGRAEQDSTGIGSTTTHHSHSDLTFFLFTLHFVSFQHSIRDAPLGAVPPSLSLRSTLWHPKPCRSYAKSDQNPEQSDQLHILPRFIFSALHPSLVVRVVLRWLGTRSPAQVYNVFRSSVAHYLRSTRPNRSASLHSSACLACSFIRLLRLSTAYSLSTCPRSIVPCRASLRCGPAGTLPRHTYTCSRRLAFMPLYRSLRAKLRNALRLLNGGKRPHAHYVNCPLDCALRDLPSVKDRQCAAHPLLAGLRVCRLRPLEP